MPLSAISLLNTTGVKSFKTEKALPDYSILFWHHIHDWNTVNSIHGNDPSAPNDNLKIFRQYEIGKTDHPDVLSQYSDPNKVVDTFNYVVRCVSNAHSWPINCDIRYDVNTNISSTQSTLLDVGGAHDYNLLGRVAPPIQNNSEAPYSSTTDYTIYTAKHSGHFHQADGIYNKIIGVDAGSVDTLSYNSTYVPSNFSSFFVDPIIKDPKLNYLNVRYIPKDIIVLYYGISTLPAEDYDQYDLSVSGSNNNIDFSANGFVLPMTMVQTISPLEAGKIGAKNINISTNKNGLSSSIDIIESKYTNSISFTVSSNTSGFHDHKALTNGKISTKTDLGYRVIIDQNKAVIYPNDVGETLTNGPDPISHAHKITYEAEVKLKEKKLKAYLSITNTASIQNGLIIGYSLGKYSGFDGDKKSGRETLPAGWYFCDGEHGTPDLRGKYPFLNFRDSNNTDENTSSSIEITSIEIETINWQQGHVYRPRPFIALEGTGTAKDSGSHSSNYDNFGDPNRTTRHTHEVSTKDNFVDGSTNMKVGASFDYEPPTVEIAFIMYNDTI